MGLRDDKQRRQRLRIIENAIALVRESGADAVRVRDIARRCEISDATFFNYFAGKDAVLCEWIEDVIDAAFARAVERCAAGSAVRRAVRGLAADLAAQNAAEGELFLRALGTIRPLRADAGGAPRRGRAERPPPAVRLMEIGRERDEIRSDIAGAELAELLRAAVVTALAHGARAVGATESTVSARIRSAADVLLDGLRKRNERVRAPARGARTASAPPGS